MLAGELATNPDYTTAFAAYERATRPFVTQNQALVSEGDAMLFPTTAEALAARDPALRSATALPGDGGRPEHSALQLPTFAVS